VELFEYALWAAPAALLVALVALLWRRWALPLLLGLAALLVGGVMGRIAWEWFADRPPGFDFGSEFEGFDWVIGFAAVGSLVGAITGLWLSARRS
jgi:hypothetical protein